MNNKTIKVFIKFNSCLQVALFIYEVFFVNNTSTEYVVNNIGILQNEYNESNKTLYYSG